MPFSCRIGFQHVRVVDVVEHDRAPLRRDPAREPAADRNPHALFDLFLEPDRRTSNELVPELVAEEHRGRVGPEHVADAHEQLGQEVFQVQVREGGIRDEQDPPQPLGVTRVAHGDRIRGSLVGPRAPLWPRGPLLRSAA